MYWITSQELEQTTLRIFQGKAKDHTVYKWDNQGEWTKISCSGLTWNDTIGPFSFAYIFGSKPFGVSENENARFLRN
jgi:hypothetical protein